MVKMKTKRKRQYVMSSNESYPRTWNEISIFIDILKSPTILHIDAEHIPPPSRSSRRSFFIESFTNCHFTLIKGTLKI